MISLKQIISRLELNTKNFRRSRIKTLAALVSAATRKRGMGVLALGRSMVGTTCAKHRIKRAWRFFRNKAVQPQPVAQALLTSALPPRGTIVLMIDWTDLPPWRTLVVGLVHRRRALPFMTITVPITGRGGMLAAEQQLLGRLRDMLPADRQIIIVADRGLGTTGWITALETLGWGYVLRLRTSTAVHVGEGDGSVPVQSGSRARRHGRATVTDYKPTTTSLVSIWRADWSEPWLLATNLSCSARAVASLYAKRM